MSKTTVPHIISKLHQLSSMKDLEKAQALMTKAGLCTHSPLISKLIFFLSLSPSGSLEYAQSIFEETAMDNTFICNTMIRAYANSVFPIKGIYIYNHMQNTNIKSDDFTYNFTLKACGRVMRCAEEDVKFDGFGVFCKGKEIHCRVLKLGFDRDHCIENSLVSMYSQFGLLDLAHRVFDEMPERSTASWNIMISGYDRVNDTESADYLLELIPEKNVVSWNTLIGRHIRLGNIQEARRVFQEMPERDAVSWNSMIAGYVQVRDYAGALKLFHEMRSAEVEATQVTLISVLGACAETGELQMGREIHESLKRKGNKIEGYLGNALVDMYAKCGNLSSARKVFDELKLKPVSCWNAMIVGLAVHGHCEEALNLFAAMEMRPDEVKPNRITFIGVLIACRHKGFVEKGRQFFNHMIETYKIMPDIKHYGCMIDLFSRWGLLDEAHQMVKSTPLVANSVLWRTLLGACRVQGNVELAEECFQQLTKLELLVDGDYVLLSNIYAEAERWNDVECVRNKMVDFGVSKKLGSSHI